MMSQANTNISDASQFYDGCDSNNSAATSIINGIWKLLSRPYVLSNDDAWACVHIQEFADHLVPTVPNGFCIPVSILKVSATDFRTYKAHFEGMEHISFFVGTNDFREYTPYWVEGLLSILIAFCGIRRPGLAGSTLCAMQHHLGGFYCINGNKNYPDSIQDPRSEMQSAAANRPVTQTPSTAIPFSTLTAPMESTAHLEATVA